jgi:hypothetical protein
VEVGGLGPAAVVVDQRGVLVVGEAGQPAERGALGEDPAVAVVGVAHEIDPVGIHQGHHAAEAVHLVAATARGGVGLHQVARLVVAVGGLPPVGGLEGHHPVVVPPELQAPPPRVLDGHQPTVVVAEAGDAPRLHDLEQLTGLVEDPTRPAEPAQLQAVIALDHHPGHAGHPGEAGLLRREPGPLSVGRG